MNDEKNDAKKRIHAMLLIERHERLRLLLLVIFVQFLDLFYLWLEPLERHLMLRAFMKQRIEDKPYEQRRKDYRNAEIPASDGFIEINEGVQNGAIEYRLIKVDHK